MPPTKILNLKPEKFEIGKNVRQMQVEAKAPARRGIEGARTHETEKRLAGDARVAIMRPPMETWMTAVGLLDIAKTCGAFSCWLGDRDDDGAPERVREFSTSSPPPPGFCASSTDAVAPGSAVRA